ncbi:MAG: T9SS type A sorting domain-containing protein [Algibacter sp.]
MKTKLLFICTLLFSSLMSYGQFGMSASDFGTGEIVITEIHNRPDKPTDAEVLAVQSSQPSYWTAGDAFDADQVDNSEGDEDHVEWFEVYNTTGSAVVMDGWVLEDQSGSGSTTIGTFTLGAGEYAVFSGFDIPAAQGGVQFDYFYDYEELSFNNESSYDGATDSSCPDGVAIYKADGTTLVDEVKYDYGFSYYIANSTSSRCNTATGAWGIPTAGSSSRKSFQLDAGFYDSEDNNNPVYWTYSTNEYDTDNAQFGTPGTVNNADSALSVGEVLSSSFKIYPNPAQDYIQIESSDVQVSSVEMYNLVGKKLISETNLVDSKLNISSLSTGVYLLKVNAEGRSLNKRIVVE